MPPVLTVPAHIVAPALNSGGATVSFTATATDNQPGVTVVCQPASGALFPLGTTTVTCTATDAAGNTDVESFTVTVNDITPPVVHVPAPIVAEATGPNGAIVLFTATATDNVDGALPVACSPASGSLFALAVTTVTCTATDAAGNKGSNAFDVTVRDTTPPQIVGLPLQNITVTATTTSGANVTYSTPSATDLVDPNPQVTCVPQSGSLFPVATTLVTCTPRDAAGNVGTSQTFTVTVNPAPTNFTTSPTAMYFKTGRLAYCNGIAVGPNWKDQGLVISNTGGTTLNYAVTTATSWLRVAAPTGSLAIGASTTLVVSVDLSHLGRGIYRGELVVTGNGTVAKTVPVTLEIGNALPTLCLTPTSKNWGSVKSGSTQLTAYDVTNVGDDPMANWTSTKTISDGTLTLSATSGAAPKTVSASVKTGKRKGSQSAAVTITVPGAVNGTQTVSMTWSVL